jgi:N-methylhydantoinase A/oxoprolinase/acetone carboxylase beta subunit
MRIGVDVGGTNTDAVLLDGQAVVAWTKQPTTANVTGGITSALRAILDGSRVAASDITAVMIGTTHFTNAVVQRRGLERTAVARLGLPATQAIPPLTDWSDELRAAIGGVERILHGGHQYDGRELSALDEAEIRDFARELAGQGVQALAISSVFSPATPDHELRAAELFARELPRVAVTLSHQIGRLGLLERENAATLNACLSAMATRTIDAFEKSMAALGVEAPLFLSQNDGTLMTAEFARRYPVLTFASGPTNSMRGAAALSQRSEAVVVDIGGTTTDAGMLVHGFPREASFEVEIGGVRTNFRMPDVVSVGLGGGSHVQDDGRAIGPLSVGYRLTRESLVFGGSRLTASDVAVAAGRAGFGDAGAVSEIDPRLVARTLEAIDARLAELVDSLKTAPGPVPVVVVGGGSVLVGESIEGASEVIRPDHAAVANAYGAAIAQVSGEIDRIFPMENRTRDSVLTEARDEAVRMASEAGAARESVEIVEIDEIPIAYLPSNALRLRVKAVGDLKG